MFIFVSRFLFLLLIFFTSVVKSGEDEALKKQALDGDPLSICLYANELSSEKKNELKWHSFALGNQGCKIDVDDKSYFENKPTIKFNDKPFDLKLLKSEAKDNPDKQLFIWLLYANGYEVSKLTAFTWLKVAAENKNLYAQTILGLLYFYGYIVPEDKEKGLLIIKNSIEGGSVYAKDLLVKLSQ
jgi:TPR repeat protein